DALGLAGAAQVVITITDDGAMPADGSAADSVGSQLGIKGMQERAGFYNGSVYAGPGKHRGWVVRAVLEPPEETLTEHDGEQPVDQPSAGADRGPSQLAGPETAEER